MDKSKGKIGALWSNTSSSGMTYLKGKVMVNGSDVDIVVFPNKFKEEEKHPDYIIMLANKDYNKKQEQKDMPQMPF